MSALKISNGTSVEIDEAGNPIHHEVHKRAAERRPHPPPIPAPKLARQCSPSTEIQGIQEVLVMLQTHSEHTGGSSNFIPTLLGGGAED